MAGVTPSAYLNFLRDGTFSDFKVICKDVEFNVHRLVVSAASPMIRVACTGAFEEATSGKIEFPEDDPAILARVILFMYTSDYPEGKPPAFLVDDSTPAEEEDEIISTKSKVYGLRHVERLKITTLVYKTADMLGMENLKVLAAERFITDAIVHLDEMDFPQSLRLMYESTMPDDTILRLPVTQLLVKHYQAVRHRPAMVDVIKQYELSAWMVTAKLWEEELGEAVKVKIMQDTIEMVNSELTFFCRCNDHPVRAAYGEDGTIRVCCSRTNCLGTNHDRRRHY